MAEDVAAVGSLLMSRCQSSVLVTALECRSQCFHPLLHRLIVMACLSHYTMQSCFRRFASLAHDQLIFQKRLDDHFQSDVDEPGSSFFPICSAIAQPTGRSNSFDYNSSFLFEKETKNPINLLQLYLERVIRLPTTC